MNALIETARDLLSKGETLVLAAIVSHMGSTPRTAGSKVIVTADGRGTGTIGGGLLEAGVMARAVALIPRGQSAVMPFDLNYETISSMNMICGGQVEVLLDCVAPTDANRERYPEAHHIGVLGTFDEALTGAHLGADDFVVILTRGHLHDQNVLARALATGAVYIGMIGSRKKRHTIYANLRSLGVPQDAIDRAHSPIGLSIGAETPEEIAVSIVAELIAVRAGVKP